MLLSENRTIICCDMKSFYASVECVDRHLDPLQYNLVVADASRTDKTICLAVSPSLKSFGVPGRPRLFEVIRKVADINAVRKALAPHHNFTGESSYAPDLADPSTALSYIIAPPRMARYMEVSNIIYGVFLRYIAPEDILVYSVDEAFMDVTAYLGTYRMDAHELAMTIIRDVLAVTGITATIGIGTNMYLAKVAMDIVAKHMPPDKDGVRIASLTEDSYRRQLWGHTPITDFWRVGPGYTRRLARLGIRTMGDIARCSLGTSQDFYNEGLLYKEFGVAAELLIDHAWGWEPCTMEAVKSYIPTHNSLSSGQVLSRPYEYDEARLIVREMADELSLDLLRKGLVTRQITLTISYDTESMKRGYTGPTHKDHYGRTTPSHAHGTRALSRQTNSTRLITDAADALYLRLVLPSLLIRRINIVAEKVLVESIVLEEERYEQLNLFTDYAAREREDAWLDKERRMHLAVLEARARYGRNALIKGMNLLKSGTAMERHAQIGGHRAGKTDTLADDNDSFIQTRQH